MVAANSLNISEAGVVTFDGVSIFKGRTLQAGTGISITNSDGVAGNPTITNTSLSSFVSGFYGDGSDGSVSFDGTSVVLGITPSANVYTLARDIFLGTSAINNGVSINTNGFRIFCNGTLTNNGTIKWDGNAGVAAIAGAALSNANSSIQSEVTIASPGTAGGAGNSGAGTGGINSAFDTFGGRGGSGGAGASAGGTAGTVQAIRAEYGNIRAMPNAIYGNQFLPNTGPVAITAGTGGGGGGGDGVNAGGGGGGGAGIVIVSSYLVSGSGTIQAVGGNGGNAAVGGTNSGGGGGGGGGVVIVISQSVASSAIPNQTINISGGSGGTKLGTGVNGSAGNIGTKILLNA